MKFLTSTLTTALFAAEAVLGAMIGYLLFLTGAAYRAPRRTPLNSSAAQSRFAIMVPAHNEERLLPDLVANLQALDYPQDLYTIFVVADNCSDRTADRARVGGATVYERFNRELVGKGHALEWLLQRIWERSERYDAFVIIDADTLVSPNFLRVMDARLTRGEKVIQGYYTVRDPDSSRSASLRAVALAVLHYLRPLGRSIVGGSAGLKGNGMVFANEILRKHRWTNSLTEDIEYHMTLLLDGQRTTFAPDAVVWAEMPNTLAASQTQNARWEKGRMEMVRNYVPQLVRKGITTRDFKLIDAAVEQIIPPFSLVTAGSILCLPLALLLRNTTAILGAIGLIVGQALYIFSGLRLAGTPPGVYRALLFAPFFIVWKIVLYVRVALGLNDKGWIRTARN
jgi:cellulose synthase/poly-beta-1,6-N-acetylglucosamine synthase-like glycosyltransferase